MKIKNKYIIGTHIMFYEIEMVSEHIQSLINAINTVENKENITIDLFYNISEYFEKVDTNVISKDELKQKCKKIYQKVLQERYLYYSGKAEPEVYEKEPFPYKVREKDAIQRYLDSDQRLSDAELKVEYYNTMIDYLESIIKTIQNRTFQIKNAIEWQKFIRGYD